MVDGTPTVRTWLYPTQGSFPRCPSIEIWLESNKHNKHSNKLDLLTEDVRIEPYLQPITEETLRCATARLDISAISANGVWGGRLEKTYFDVSPPLVMSTTGGMGREVIAAELATVESMLQEFFFFIFLFICFVYCFTPRDGVHLLI